jgi:hypothetical protein
MTAKPASKRATEGTVAQPWQLKAPPGSSSFEAYREPMSEPPTLLVDVEHDPRTNRMRAR